MDVAYRFSSSIPYSLHDGRVHKMVWENGDLRLFFEDGYLELSQPPRPAEGQVRIRQVEEDFSFEIVDEHDGYQGLIYGGYLSLPERENVVDMTLSITYTGAIFYERAE